MWILMRTALVLAGLAVAAAAWTGTAAAYDFDDLSAEGSENTAKASTSGQTRRSGLAFGQAFDRAAGNQRREAQCEKWLGDCDAWCIGLNKSNGGFLTDSDKDKCVNYCNDSRNMCMEGNMCSAELYKCKARCAAYRDDDGGFIARSSMEKCMDQCRYRHGCN